MNVRNCRKCGKIFNYAIGPSICPACRDQMEANFQEVKKYIQDHHTATIPEVSEECHVDASQIKQWIREERLQFADDSPIKVNCEGCGTMIGSGRFCEKCKNDMMRGLKHAAAPVVQQPEQLAKSKSTNNKMRFLDQ